MEAPCLKGIQDTFVSEMYGIEPEKVRSNGCEPLIYVFPQTWGSTALGFSGIGGQAMTSAYTTVVTEDYLGYCGVFFGNRLAYIIKNPKQRFFEDLANHNMRPVREKGVYLRDES